jgi:hypothetical protein
LQWNCTVSSKQDFFPLKFDGWFNWDDEKNDTKIAFSFISAATPWNKLSERKSVKIFCIIKLYVLMSEQSRENILNNWRAKSDNP